MTASLSKKIKSLPTGTGVYVFKDGKGHILYIGKAKNIRKRVVSHFVRRSEMFLNFYPKIRSIETISTRSEKNALILERQLIQRYQPFYNLDLKDDKNFFFVEFTREKLPRVYITHQPKNTADIAGPFVYGKEFKEYLRTLRRLFPYRTCGARLKSSRAKSTEALAKEDKKLIDKPCLYYHLGLCWAHKEKAASYRLVMAGLKTFLSLYAGKKTHLEAFDVSNTGGALSVGSMVSFKNGRPDKSMYRRFKIKTVRGSNDPASLKEIINRRLTHTEWVYSDLIVIDGGRTQLSALKHLPIPVIGLAKLGRPQITSTLKRSVRRAKNAGVLWSPYGSGPVRLDTLPESVGITLLALRDEAHRFAITYHRLRRTKNQISSAT